jgi:hypothetical protein
MAMQVALNIGWILGAAALGFAVSAGFAGLLRLRRDLYLVAYLVLVAPFLYAFIRWSQMDVGDVLKHNWVWGIILALLVGIFVVRNVLSQPASTASKGAALAWNIVWLGIVYGALDALLLSVLPVLATWQAFSAFAWAQGLAGKLAVGILALLASLFVAVAYHLGYPEYRVSGGIKGPSIGNSVMSLGYVLANNPLAAVFSHIAMHIAGVLHGPASVMQLPPHY